MTLLNITKKSLSLLLLFVAVFTSCKKDDNTFAESRPTIVRLKDAENAINVNARDVLPAIDNFVLIDLRRDATDAASLNQAVTVKIEKDASIITDYNAANSTNYIELPAAAYTFAEDLNNITFQAGEFVKEIKITVNKATLSLSDQYALGLKVTQASGGNVIVSNGYRKALYSIGIKNQYDGRYRLDGAFYHPTQSPGYDAFTVDIEMHTSGPNSVKLYVPDFGGYYSPGLFGGTLNAFGAQEPEFTINPSTNAVTVQNSYPGAVTFYTMGPGYTSRYDPPTRKIYARWGYNYSPGPTFNPATSREWTDEFTYLGPR